MVEKLCTIILKFKSANENCPVLMISFNEFCSSGCDWWEVIIDEKSSLIRSHHWWEVTKQVTTHYRGMIDEKSSLMRSHHWWEVTKQVTTHYRGVIDEKSSLMRSHQTGDNPLQGCDWWEVIIDEKSPNRWQPITGVWLISHHWWEVIIDEKS